MLANNRIHRFYDIVEGNYLGSQSALSMNLATHLVLFENFYSCKKKLIKLDSTELAT